MNLFLASTSPRRHDILNKYNVPFKQVDHKDIEDTLRTKWMHPMDACAEHAWCKAHAVKDVQEGVVMGVDTMVFFNSIPFGKPKSPAEAKAMLLNLQGYTHNVVTACCLCDVAASKVQYCIDIARVTIKHLPELALEKYLDTNLWQGKAGGYGIQDGLPWVDCMVGDFYTIMGLPINKLLKIFKGYGIV